jgi:hypothetical protein
MNAKVAGWLLGVVSLAVAVVPVLAQGRGRQGQGAADYNLAAETTVRGTVEDLKPGPQQGMHIMLKTADATLELALGPPGYQTEKKYELAKGDSIEAIKNTVDGRDVLLVREIKKGTETMTFRDANGFPMWEGAGADSRDCMRSVGRAVALTSRNA